MLDSSLLLGLLCLAAMLLTWLLQAIAFRFYLTTLQILSEVVQDLLSQQAAGRIPPDITKECNDDSFPID